jgi:hypothetical protein
MSTTWTLLYDGTEKTLADWGLTNLQRTLVSQGQDRVTFTADGAHFDSDQQFADKSTIIIKRDGVRWFHGRVIRSPRLGDPGAEALTYELAGPWWYLDECVFQQQWRTTNGETSDLIPTYKSRIILCQTLTGTDGYTKAHIGEQITEAIQWAIDQGAPIQIGTIVPDMVIPYQEVTDRTCAEIIKLMLRWNPDAVTSFDYTTTPPTLHIKRRAQASTVSLSATTGAPGHQIRITPLTKLQVPAVVLKFEQEHNIDGSTFSTTIVDKYPEAATGLEFSAIIMTLELGGINRTFQRQTFDTENISPETRSWWEKKFPWIKDATEFEIEEDSGTVQLAEPEDPENPEEGAYPYEIVEGAIPPWLADDAAECIVTAKATYIITNPVTGAEAEYEGDLLTATLTGTDRAGGEYSRLIASTPAEPIPENMAQNFYAALSILQYEGTFTLLEEEITGAATLGQLLNLTDGRTDWATMNAQIQQVTEDVDHGLTTIHFGPADHLSPQDIIELLRVNRGRVPTWRLNERATGEKAPSAGTADGPAHTPNKNASTSHAGLKKLVLASGDNIITLDAEEGTIKLESTASEAAVIIDIADITGGEILRARATTGCDDESASVLRTEFS